MRGLTRNTIPITYRIVDVSNSISD